MKYLRSLKVSFALFIAVTFFTRIQSLEKQTVKRWYATSTEFLVIPCFTKDDVKSKEVSLIRWYESFGNPTWASFYLTIQVYEKEDKRSFFCDTYDWKGVRLGRFWHKIEIYVQPLIFFDFLCSIPTEDIFSIEDQTMTPEGKTFMLKLKKRVAKICKNAERCRFATVLLDQSLKEKIALSSVDVTSDMLQLADKHDNETTQVSVTYQIDINDRKFLALKPEVVYSQLVTMMRDDFSRYTQDVLLTHGRITIKPSVETFCPAGYMRRSQSIRCSRCPPGSASAVGSASCTECARGFFQPEAAKAECIPCPPMYVTRYTGSKNLAECIVDGNFLINVFAQSMEYFWKILANADFDNYNYVVLGTFVYFFGISLIVMKMLYRIYIFKSLKSHYKRVETRLLKVASLGQFTIAERQNIQINYKKMLDKEREALHESYL